MYVLGFKPDWYEKSYSLQRVKNASYSIQCFVALVFPFWCNMLWNVMIFDGLKNENTIHIDGFLTLYEFIYC